MISACCPLLLLGIRTPSSLLATYPVVVRRCNGKRGTSGARDGTWLSGATLTSALSAPASKSPQTWAKQTRLAIRKQQIYPPK